MFKATGWEYRNRYMIHVAIFTAGFSVPWNRLWRTQYGQAWEVFATGPYQRGWMGIHASTMMATALGLALLVAGAWMRTWGSAYMGAEVVSSRGMHGQGMVADGPYRHVRNPLYEGTWLHVLAICMVMEPLGAIFTAVASTWLQLRLIGAEEPFLKEKLGEPYAEYCAKVPRLLFAPMAKVPAGGQRGRWGHAVVGEIYFILVAGAYAVLFALYGTMLLPEHTMRLLQCVLGALGVSLIGDAVMMGRPKAAASD